MPEQASREKRRQGRQLPLIKKIIFALTPTVAFLGVAEISLALIGFEPLTGTRDPYVGFASSVSLMEENNLPDGQQLLVTRPSKLVWFNAQQFLKKKPSNTFRVFCMGGSTTYGRPYSDLTSFCGWLREYLPLVDDSRQWEVINAGGVSYASYRVAAVMQELSTYDPDLFIVYSAHNEFLESRTYASLMAQPTAWLNLQGWLSKTRLVALGSYLAESSFNRAARGSQSHARHTSASGVELLPAEVDERLNHTIGPADYQRDEAWEQKVLLHYSSNLRRMVNIARVGRAKIVFITPAANIKDCSPFKGQPGKLIPSKRQTAAQLVAEIGTSIANGQTQQSLELLSRAAALDPANADVQYQLGRRLFDEARTTEAEEAFRRALNEDVCALRAISEIDDAIRRVADEMRVPLVDFGRLLNDKCNQEYEHRCLGQEYFLDHVHPTVDVHEQLAQWILATLQQEGLIAGLGINDPQLKTRLEAVREAHLARIDHRQHGVALRNLAKVLHWSGKFEEAAPRAADALSWLGEDAESRLVFADCLKNLSQPEKAREQYELLFQNDPDYGRALLPYGELLTELSESEQALAYLLMAILNEPDNAHAHFTLGRTHMQREEFSLAVESLERADQLQPQDPAIQSLLSKARIALTQDLETVSTAE